MLFKKLATTTVTVIITMGSMWYLWSIDNQRINEEHDKAMQELLLQMEGLEKDKKGLELDLEDLRIDNQKLRKSVDFIESIKEMTGLTSRDVGNMLAVASSYDYPTCEVLVVQMAIMDMESDFTHLGMNSTGDVGIMQVNDATWSGHREVFGEDWDAYNHLDNIKGGTREIFQCIEKAKSKHPDDWVRWSYIYYNAGRWVESQDYWNSSSFQRTMYARGQKFQDHYLQYKEFISGVW